MTTPSGQISLNDVNVELGKSGTTLISLGASDVRGLAGVASGQISMNNLRGKSSSVTLSYTFSANTANASLNLSAISGYSAGKSNITVTINSGVYLYATSTGNYGLNITGGTTGDTLTIVNNGYIMGQGGNGGGCVSTYPYGDAIQATSGGPALNLGFGMSSCTINNTNTSAYIGGGGGGGGVSQNGGAAGAGGGAGGGNGGAARYSAKSGTEYQPGGSGGGIGASGANGYGGGYVNSGGGGGRVFPGVGGGFAYLFNNQYRAFGGTAGGGGGGQQSGSTGGSANNPGGAGGTYYSAGGGGWGASGGNAQNSGGSGGKAVNLNGKSVTWTSGNTTRVYGAVS